MQTTNIKSLNNNIPQNFLLQNYPNPFNCETTIEYGTSKSGKVRISIVNEIGQQVMTLFDRETQPGNHSIIWNGTDQYGLTVPSGIYFCRIITAHQNKIIKMMLLK
jgi:flagellar hook assembly protein FlgD